jgi:hypothetical protein
MLYYIRTSPTVVARAIVQVPANSQNRVKTELNGQTNGKNKFKSTFLDNGVKVTPKKEINPFDKASLSPKISPKLSQKVMIGPDRPKTSPVPSLQTTPKFNKTNGATLITKSAEKYKKAIR